jgi:uncharacterized damage-inducible protein DinB
MPDATPYTARILAYTEGQDPLIMQREMPALIAKLVEGATKETLKQRPAPGKWSVREILAHLADDEIATAWRYRQILEHNGVRLEAFDQDEWARLGDYASWEPAEALALFRLLREANLRLLARLTAEQWQRHGVHAERGKVTIRELARHMAGHDRNHLDQIRKILG